MRLQLSPAVGEEIRAHGARGYPHEVCGALLGRQVAADGNGDAALREVTALLPLENRRDDSPRNRFSVAPEDVLRAERAAEASSLELLGWYHSHPDHPARPSEFDREHAWPWYSYVILSVAEREPGEMTSWRLADDRSGYAAERIELG
ncbi:MAG TPA: M67 family metallopeptidase [Candidatus Acidoferrales bacterium]|nr:M67 family metallopeptidase [Candidatus Acidoferrales bacterium]